MRQRRPDRERLRNLWPMGKPKTPGYGISTGFYLTVLSTKATLPTLVEVIEPGGTNGAVPGFGVPLAANSTKEDLNRPLARGAYALADLERKTVLKLFVLSKEEAFFDPDPILSAPLAADLAPEVVERLRATWTLLQLTFQAHDPMVASSLEFLLNIAGRLSERCDGLVADPICRRYLLPHQLRHRDPPGPIDARNFVSTDQRPARPVAVFTRGMVKFGLPEFELVDVPLDWVERAQVFLVGAAQAVFNHGPVAAGGLLGSRKAPFEVREGGLDPLYWEGIPCFELHPTQGVARGLDAWWDENR
ncbi:MAG: hypothetical protein ACK4XJ_10560 [Fimbriimonadaceae bacterium]